MHAFPSPSSYSKAYVSAVYKFQAIWKGHLERKNFNFVRSLSSPKHNYFNSNDLRQSFSSQKIEIPLKIDLVSKTYKYPSGAVYVGEFFKGFRHGNGLMKWPDGSTYKGEWSFGYPYGQGSFTYIDNDTFEGQWTNLFILHSDIYNEGFAWLNFKHESFANFEENLKIMIKDLHSKFEKICENLEIPKQYIEEKLRTLQTIASIEIKKGITYQGDLINNQRQGFGKNIWENGDVYEGEWENDSQNGWGRNLWVDNSKYIGGYKENLKHGVGEYIWEDGTVYLGDWKENTIHGIGKYSWADGREYLGSWNQGVMHGFGVFHWKDGKKYQGFWKNGKKDGIGMSISADHKQHIDVWANGKIVKKKSNN